MLISFNLSFFSVFLNTFIDIKFLLIHYFGREMVINVFVAQYFYQITLNINSCQQCYSN